MNKNKLVFKPTNRGFTLIELLVVVLIIGILTSVALPQYQKAVAKARLSNFLQQNYAIKKYLDVYFLANNTPPRHAEDLDLWDSVTVNGNHEYGYIGRQNYAVSSDGLRTYVSLGIDTLTCDFNWDRYYRQGNQLSHCYAYKDSSQKLLAGMGWKVNFSTANATSYWLPEN